MNEFILKEYPYLRFIFKNGCLMCRLEETYTYSKVCDENILKAAQDVFKDSDEFKIKN